MGASVSAAQSFFDLFDRTPTIDNGSTNGRELVSMRCTHMNRYSFKKLLQTDFRGEIKFDLIKFAYPTRPASYIFDKFRLTIKPGKREKKV